MVRAKAESRSERSKGKEKIHYVNCRTLRKDQQALVIGVADALSVLDLEETSGFEIALQFLYCRTSIPVYHPVQLYLGSHYSCVTQSGTVSLPAFRVGRNLWLRFLLLLSC